MEQQRKHARCYVYLRVSSLGQVDGDGFERQLVAVRSYAQANGIKIAKNLQRRGREWHQGPGEPARVAGTADGAALKRCEARAG